MRMLPDGSQVGVVARGLRNAFDGFIHPTSGQIIVSDNGPNAAPGVPNPPDELNIIEPGNDYGHPLYWGTPPPGTNTVRPLLDLPAHAAPTGIAVDPGESFSGYKNQIFLLAFSNGTGGAIFRIPFFYGPVSGTPLAWYEFFASNLDYPIDCEFSSRGELYILEYLSGRVRLMRPASAAAVRIDDQPTLDTICHMTFRAPGHPGSVYVAAASTAVGPAIPLAPGVDLLLDLLSPVFVLSMQPGNPFFYFGSPGILDSSGEALAAVVIPPQAFLIGAGVEIQFIVLDPQSLQWVAASPPQRMTFLPAF
jgi:glucose/arabinose dehydrogenase